MSQTIGPTVQFTIAERQIFEYHGSGVRRAFCLLLKQLMDQRFLWEISLGGIELYQ